MREDLRLDLIGRLKRDYGLKARGAHLRGGKCPACGERELFIATSQPNVLKCGRENKCGWSASTKELYPDAFEKLNERYPATTDNPNATADAYLLFVRHLDIRACRGWYRQGSFSHRYGNRRTATVVFDIMDPRAPDKNLWMERLVEPVTVSPPGDDSEVRKANFVGDYKGLWWAPPGFAPADGQEIWLVEGCIDAISLHQHGVPAVATLSCYNYPDVSLDALRQKGIRPRLVWALDNDVAGCSRILQHVATAREAGYTCSAALIPQVGTKKLDWNDAHASGGLSKDDLELYRHEGSLLLAPTARAKALLIWERKRNPSFALEYGARTFWFELPAASFMLAQKAVREEPAFANEDDATISSEAAERAAEVREIANVVVSFLYFQKSELVGESWYYSKIDFPNKRKPIKDTFTGTHIAAAAEFKKRLLSIAPGALFTGSTHQLNWIVKNNIDGIRQVQTIDFVGYASEYKTWVFNSHAVSAGRVYELNSEDFFEVQGLSIKSLSMTSSLQLRIGNRTQYSDKWLELVYRSFGAKGIVTAAFYLGTLFAEQIRQQQQSFPFLELSGQAGSGKTTLIEALWKLVGRTNYEGFDPNKSTSAARSRIMSQVGNLPVVFIESDRGGDGSDGVKQRQFDWDEIKTAYNGRPSRATGVANGGNDTKEPPFRGSVIISQNSEVKASEAIMTRIVHLHFDTSEHTEEGRVAADALATMPVETMSWFVLMATTQEAMVLKMMADRIPVHERELAGNPMLKTVRIRKNHAQLMALVEALAQLTAMPAAWLAEAMNLLRAGALKRQGAIAEDDPTVDRFWDIVEYLGVENCNHISQPGYVAVNLNHVCDLASKSGQSLPPVIELKRTLKSSRSRQFLDYKTVRSIHPGFAGRNISCYVFRQKAE
ncbi:MAG: hypothetical protein RLY86_112 [Pseudomonadota bacterium]|jgi:energy-coupling factor transporter ATP-binding protein EcfA2